MKPVCVACLLLGSALGGSASTAEAQRVPIGFIESIEGKVTLSPGELVLNRDTDRGRILFSGESLKCASGARVKGALVGGGKTAVVPNLCNRPLQPATMDRVEAQDSLLQEDLLRFGKRAGRDKGSESPIFEPAPDATILPGTLVVHWRTRPPLDTFTAVLEDASGKSLAQVPGVDGAAGVLDSTALREALLKLRAGADAPVGAKLEFQVSSGAEYSVSFSILPERAERELHAKLDQAAAAGGLLGHVQRAGVLEAYGLYGEVATEYGRALEEAPRSLDLLRAAMDSYARIGDLRHAREIRDRLDQEEGGRE